MKNIKLLGSFVFVALIILSYITPLFSTTEYPWQSIYNKADTIKNRIPVPKGYHRIAVPQKSFKYWLRHLPLKKAGSAVYLYNGEKKSNQSAHHSAIDIDVGNKDLQQCADAVMRLKAEYHYSIDDYGAIQFNFTSGDKASFKRWIEGYRPGIKGNKVRWRKRAKYDRSYTNLRRYLNTVYMYAGTYSLSKELQSVGIHEMEIGDVFIQGGFPGHAVIVVDMAIHPKTGKKIFLLAQSYMPAQDIHILKNPADRILSPWYEVDFGQKLQTPEWTFKKNQLKRFRR